MFTFCLFSGIKWIGRVKPAHDCINRDKTSDNVTGIDEFCKFLTGSRNIIDGLEMAKGF